MLNARKGGTLTLTLKAIVVSGTAKPSRSYQDRRRCTLLSKMRYVTLSLIGNSLYDGKKMLSTFFSIS